MTSARWTFGLDAVPPCILLSPTLFIVPHWSSFVWHRQRTSRREDEKQIQRLHSCLHLLSWTTFTILSYKYRGTMYITSTENKKRVCDAAFPPPGVSSCTAGRDKCLAWGCLSRANTYQHRSLNPYPLAERRCPFHYGFLQPLNTLHEGWLLWLQALLIILLLP